MSPSSRIATNVADQALLNVTVIMIVEPAATEEASSTPRKISGANAGSVMGPDLYRAAMTGAKERQVLTPTTKTALIAMVQD